MAERYQIEFTEGGVGLFETLATGGLAPIIEKSVDAVFGDDNHGWYCTITDKVTELKESQWGVTKEEAQERTFYALKRKIENYEEEQRREKEEAEEAEYQRSIQRQRQSVSQSSGGSVEEALFRLGAKMFVYILIAVAILWLVFTVALLILINIASVALIAGLTKSKWRTFFFSVSILGAIFIVIDYNSGWLTKALVSNVSFFEGLIPLFLYLNITTGLVAAYFLIRDYLNGKSEPAEGEGEFSKRNLIVMGSLLVVGGLTVGLQKYFDSQRPQVIEAIGTTNPNDDRVQVVATGYVQTKDGSTLRLRSAPSTEAAIITNIPNRTTVAILGYSDHFEEINGEKGKWCKVNFNGMVGWAWGKFIVRAESITPTKDNLPSPPPQSNPNSSNPTPNISTLPPSPTPPETPKEQVPQFKWITCADCSGSGQIQTSGSCPKCNGSSEIICSNCNGQGKSLCGRCDGKGKLVCSSCGGKANLTCYMCGGRINSTCGMCGGNGIFYGQTCATCKGTGKTSCYTCKATGKTPCHTCKQTGFTVCHKCKETGYVQCNSCRQTGKVKCNTCNGKGQVLGKVNCSKCEGKGQIQVSI